MYLNYFILKEDETPTSKVASCDNFVLVGVQSPSKIKPPADRRGAQMKAPSERAPRGKNAGGVLELLGGGNDYYFYDGFSWNLRCHRSI